VSDQAWTVVGGIAMMLVVKLMEAALRILEWYFPKGHHSVWAEKHGVKTTTLEAEEEAPGKLEGDKYV
jgi:hypothetical protein